MEIQSDSTNLEKVRKFQFCFDRLELTKIPWEENIRADAMVQEGSEIDQEINATKRKVLIRAFPSITWKQDMVQIDEVCRLEARAWNAKHLKYYM